MKAKFVIRCIMGLAFALAYSTIASADGGPRGHDDVSAATCVQCHRANTAQASNPGQGDSQACLSCHSAEGQARTNVVEGVWKGAGGGDLLGGGFARHKGAAVTSSHAQMSCSTCHSFHGGENYRMLKEQPRGARVTSNETGGIAPHLPGYAPNYTNPSYREGMSEWCLGCHAAYDQTLSANPAGGLVAAHRHKVNTPIRNVTNAETGITYNLTTRLPLEDPTGNGRSLDDRLFCLTCHYAHGSSAVMAPGATLAANDSALLRMDNRGVCQDCHKK